MRTIKFRAWDKEEKKMYLVYKLVVPNFDSGAIKLLKNNSQPEKVEWQSLGSVVLMQFTGLLDKNGKEIYEGDIMEIWDSTYGKIKYTIVKWNIKKAEWVGCWGREVVGNIYENPELLTASAGKEKR